MGSSYVQDSPWNIYLCSRMYPDSCPTVITQCHHHHMRRGPPPVLQVQRAVKVAAAGRKRSKAARKAAQEAAAADSTPRKPRPLTKGAPSALRVLGTISDLHVNMSGFDSNFQAQLLRQIWRSSGRTLLANRVTQNKDELCASGAYIVRRDESASGELSSSYCCPLLMAQRAIFLSTPHFYVHCYYRVTS